MKHIVALLLSISFAFANPTGKLVFVFQTTDVALFEDIEAARRWKDFFWIAHLQSGDALDAMWAAYYAGVEAHAQKQFDECHKL